jgi:hypothetical protein
MSSQIQYGLILAINSFIQQSLAGINGTSAVTNQGNHIHKKAKQVTHGNTHVSVSARTSLDTY